MVTADSIDLGPFDYLVVEFPPGATNFSREMAHEIAELVRAGTIRLYDVLIIVKHDSGRIEAFEMDISDPPNELRALERDLAEILSARDVASLAASMENGSTAGVIVWENRWAAPLSSAARRGGDQVVATGRIPLQAIAASFESERGGDATTVRATGSTDKLLHPARTVRRCVIAAPVPRTAATPATTAAVVAGLVHRQARRADRRDHER
jgi:hypothetical protein